VYAALRLAGADPLVSLMAACLSVETAPATTLAIVRESRAKGPFVKTLLGVVSLDSIACILLFEFLFIVAVDHFATGGDRLNFAMGVTRSLQVFLVSAALGAALGALVTHVFRAPRFPGSSTMIVAILFAAGLSSALGVSSLLTCLALGIYLGNGTNESEKRVDALVPLEPLIYTAFFTLAGISIHLDLLADAGVLCLVYVAARFAGKAAGAYLGAKAYGASPRIARNMPLAMMPQASVAAGLVVMMRADPRAPADFTAFVATLILSGITINEIVGPVLKRLALRNVGEAGLDRPKLVDFLHEEFILTDLQAADKWEALRKLAEFYGRTHNVRGKHLETVYASVEERERQGSTALGRASALPHGRVDSGPGIQGVLAIAPKGIDFDAPDGQPVKLIVLIVTPQDHEARHLDVLASLSAMASDERIFGRLILAKDANEAWEILSGTETRSYNYFLESDDSTATV
ncbi:MAG: PTS sugar transporter subunit IIA, partial [Candidatus Hydrogenedentota bacterium]